MDVGKARTRRSAAVTFNALHPGAVSRRAPPPRLMQPKRPECPRARRRFVAQVRFILHRQERSRVWGIGALRQGRERGVPGGKTARASRSPPNGRRFAPTNDDQAGQEILCGEPPRGSREGSEPRRSIRCVFGSRRFHRPHPSDPRCRQKQMLRGGQFSLVANSADLAKISLMVGTPSPFSGEFWLSGEHRHLATSSLIIAATKPCGAHGADPREPHSPL